MASIVPKYPAPVPAPYQPGGFFNQMTGGATPATGTLRPQQPPYSGTDWGRLAGRGSPTAWWAPGPDPNNPTVGATSGGGINAIPPGFSEASIPSKYGVAWRGAAFGPSGRLAAPSQKPWPGTNKPGFGPGEGTILPRVGESFGPLPETPIGPWPTPGTGTIPPLPGPVSTGPLEPVTTYLPGWGPGTGTLPPPGPVSTGPLEPVTTYLPGFGPGTGTVLPQPGVPSGPTPPQYTIVTNPWATLPKTDTVYRPW